MEDLALQKISISGPTLASILQRISSAPADADGLIFGHVTHLTPSTLSDDSVQTPSDPQLVATISGFVSFRSPLSFYDAAGRIDLARIPRKKSTIGWFSSRRKTPLRPSVREFAVSHSIYSSPNLSPQFSPSVFLLFTTPLQDQWIQTNQYKGFQFLMSKRRFVPVSIDIVNIGPAFRGHYGSFSPNSGMPFLGCELRGSNLMIEDRSDGSAQEELDIWAEGMEVGKLSRLVGPDAANYTVGLEDLYEKMLAKAESLARLVEASSAKVLEQENHNRKLRHQVARSAGVE